MTDKTAAPLYDLRGLKLIGWRDMQHALDYLYADGEIKRGTLVAMNAEKLLTVEDDPVVRALIEAAEFKYADGISVVRSLRKKFPQAQVSRVAGADLWEHLMMRAGLSGTPVFLVGENRRCWRKPSRNCARSGRSISWVARMVILRRISVRRCLRVSGTAERKLSPLRWDRHGRRFLCVTAALFTPMPCLWALAGRMTSLPDM